MTYAEWVAKAHDTLDDVLSKDAIGAELNRAELEIMQGVLTLIGQPPAPLFKQIR